MTRSESAAELLINHKVNCAQAVLTAFCEELELSRDTALKVAKCFGGGISGSGNVCGAVTGAYMVIGLKQGTLEPDPPGKEKTKKAAQDFTMRFAQIHGSIMCKQLLGYDVSKPDEFEVISQKKLFISICPKLVRDSIVILEKSLFK